MTAKVGVDFKVTRARGLAELQAAIAQLATPPIDELMDTAGAIGVSQTQRRIQEEKKAPDGSSWRAWNPGYAETRGPQHSLLIDTGALVSSMTFEADSDGVFVGTNLAYAERQNEMRPFLGISDANEDEFAEIGAEWLEALINA